MIGTFWTQNMTVTGSMTELVDTDDGKTLYAEVSDSDTEYKSDAVELAILGLYFFLKKKKRKKKRFIL